MELSVIVITKNEKRNISNCLNSLTRNIEGYINEFEVILVDSNSSDNTIDIAKKYQGSFDNFSIINIVESSQYSAALSRSIGLQNSKGNYVLFIDGDMEVQNGFIAQAITFLENISERVIGVIGKRNDIKHLNDEIDTTLTNIYNISKVQECIHFGGAILFKRNELLEVGGYDKNVLASEEPELYLRIKKKKYKVFEIPAEMINHNIRMAKKKTLFQKFFQSRSKGLGQTFYKILKNDSLKELGKHKPLMIFFVPTVTLLISFLFLSLFLLTESLFILIFPLIINIFSFLFLTKNKSLKHFIYVTFNFYSILNGFFNYKETKYKVEKII